MEKSNVYVGRYDSVVAIGAVDGIAGSAIPKSVTWDPPGEVWYRCLRTWDPAHGARPPWLEPHRNGMSPRGGTNAPYRVRAGSTALSTSRAVVVHLADGPVYTNAISASVGRQSLLYNPAHGFGEELVISPRVFQAAGGQWIPQGGPAGIQAHLSRVHADLAARGLAGAASDIERIALLSAGRDFENLLIDEVPARAVRPKTVYLAGRAVRVLGGVSLLVIVIDEGYAAQRSIRTGSIRPLAWTSVRNASAVGAGTVTSWALMQAAPWLGLAAGGAAPLVLAVGGAVVISALVGWGFGALEESIEGGKR